MGELKLYEGRNIYYYNSVKNFFRKCECIGSCYVPISSNLLKTSLRNTSLFVLFELLPTGLLKHV